MAKKNPNCPFCHKPAKPGQSTSHCRRGKRVLAVDVSYWECPSGCTGPDGEQPFRFEDPALLRKNSEVTRLAWMSKFGEAMPAPRRPGRKTRDKRTERFAITLTKAEKIALRARSHHGSLSEHIRQYALHAPLRSRSAPGFPLVENEYGSGSHRRAR